MVYHIGGDLDALRFLARRRTHSNGHCPAWEPSLESTVRRQSRA